MVQVLIPTHSKDVHALAVAHVLQLQGHRPTLWYGTDFPSRQNTSIKISPQGSTAWAVNGPALQLNNTPFDVVWYRRPTSAVLPEQMHAGDRKIAERECKAFTAALWRSLAPEAFWINPLESRDRATSKPLQLLEAGRVGLKVPPTLCSNDPGEIRRFIDEHDGDVVYKAFWPAQWDKGDEGAAVLFTAPVTLASLPDDRMLRLSPGIFQPRIRKEYELRVTYMGGYQVAAKLLSQESTASELDWRAVFMQKEPGLKVERAKLPTEIHESCRWLMDRLGIVFGCFDFIVTQQGEYIFLEVNQMGQFLWIEELNPEILLLQPFADFIVSCDPGFEWKSSGTRCLWGNLRQEIISQMSGGEVLPHVAGFNKFTVPDQYRPIEKTQP